MERDNIQPVTMSTPEICQCHRIKKYEKNSSIEAKKKEASDDCCSFGYINHRLKRKRTGPSALEIVYIPAHAE
jgi:hypothetical protein